MKTFILFVLVFSTSTLYAGRIRDIDFSVDSSSFGTTNTFAITVYLIKKNGKRIEIKPNEISLHWNKIAVKGQHILSFKHGIVTFNQAQIINGINSIVLDVSYNNNEHAIQKPLTFPYVKGIIIQNNTIPVNHLGALYYQLIFSNGKIANPSPALFDDNNLVNTSAFEVNLKNSSIMMKLDEPVAYETVELSITNKLNNQPLGKKTLIIEYPTSCRIEASGRDGLSGKNGTNGKNVSENATSGTNGQSATSGMDVKVFAKTMKVNDVNFLILHTFYSNGFIQTEILKYDGKPINISTFGGRGGSGGNGGIGMSGLIDKTKQIDSPKGGDGGNGGNAGNGGNGGNLEMIFTKETGDISTWFAIYTRGGDAGIPGTGGAGGKGDYTDSKLVGKVLSNKDGKTGTTGLNGTNGTHGLVRNPIIISAEEWNALYIKTMNEGFVK